MDHCHRSLCAACAAAAKNHDFGVLAGQMHQGNGTGPGLRKRFFGCVIVWPVSRQRAARSQAVSSHHATRLAAREINLPVRSYHFSVW